MIIQITSKTNGVVEKYNVPVPRVGEKIRIYGWGVDKTVVDVLHNYISNKIEVYVD